MSDEEKKDIEQPDEQTNAEAPQTWADPEGSTPAESTDSPAEEESKPGDPADDPKPADDPEPDPKPDPKPADDPKPDPDQGPSKTAKTVKTAKKAATATAGAAKAAGAKIGKGAKAVWSDPLVCVRKLDSFVDWFRDTFPSHMYKWVADWMIKLGHVSMVAAAVIGIAFAITATIKFSAPTALLYGLGFVLMLFIAQYTADKFLGAGEAMIASSPSVLTSPAFLQCISLIAEVAGILAFIGYLMIAIHQKVLQPVWIGLGIWIVCEAITFIAVHPSLANTEVSETASSGEEALGILSFFMKTIMRLVPVVFGTGALLGTFALLATTLRLLFGKMDADNVIQAALQAAGPVIVIAKAALLPFAAYIVYTVYCLIIEAIRALLSLGQRD